MRIKIFIIIALSANCPGVKSFYGFLCHQSEEMTCHQGFSSPTLSLIIIVKTFSYPQVHAHIIHPLLVTCPCYDDDLELRESAIKKSLWACIHYQHNVWLWEVEQGYVLKQSPTRRRFNYDISVRVLGLIWRECPIYFRSSPDTWCSHTATRGPSLLW